MSYDNESWGQTPRREQERPTFYEKRFCDLAHTQGLSCSTGPAQDLCGVLSHPPNEAYAQCYLQLDLAGKAARYADVVDIQAQALAPRGASAYASFVRRAAAQARQANPEVTILANIAPSPNGQLLSEPRIYHCAKAALPFIDGYYTTVSRADAPTMMAVLKRLES